VAQELSAAFRIFIALLHSARLPDGALFEPVEAILKGKEARLPPGATFTATSVWLLA